MSGQQKKEIRVNENDVQRDAYDVPVEGDLPQVNVKKILDVWDWLSFTQGRGDQPFWYQGDWVNGGMDTSKWDQGSIRNRQNWGLRDLEENFCGTSCCVAGYVSFQAAIKEISESGRVYYRTPKGTYEIDGVTYGEEGYRPGWDEMGREILGLTPTESDHVFHASNTREDIKRQLNMILEHRGESVRL